MALSLTNFNISLYKRLRHFNPSPDNNLDYREIFLGFKIYNNSSRWLTDAEISNGIINAVASNKAKYVVGQIEPAGLRP